MPPLFLALTTFCCCQRPAAAQAQSINFVVLRRLDIASEGAVPLGPLVQGADGLFYGTASAGAASRLGSVFRFDADGGNFSVLFPFFGPPDSGASPVGGLLQARDGFFYGTTAAGGFNNFGTLFRFDPTSAAPAPAYLASFNLGSLGTDPESSLVEAFDGSLRGTATGGGNANAGAFFRVDVPSGALLPLSSFFGALDGAFPSARPVRSSRDGNFYGTTLQGGLFNGGTIYRVDGAGARTVVFDFNADTIGSLPRALTEGFDTNFYGVTRTGGTLGVGTIFRFDPTARQFDLLYTFSPSDGSGYDAFGDLLRASDGNFYGTTSRGGAFDAGTIFRVTPGGAFATLYSFTNNIFFDGANPQAALTQGADGRLYGTAAGVEGQPATIFRVDLGLPRPTPLVRFFNPTVASVGDTVALVGEAFVGASAVLFTGENNTLVPASAFQVVSGTYLLAQVPDGAVTGPVTVVNADAAQQPSAATLTVSVPGSTPPPPANTLAVVSLIANDAAASLVGPDNGQFLLTRAGGDLAQPLAVRFTVSGSALRARDYALANANGTTIGGNPFTLTFPAGADTLTIDVVPRPGAFRGRARNVILRLAPDPQRVKTYTLGASNTATVTIAAQ
ncbi:MAG: hypothetical protein JO117_03430 [Verrucomicrobia bacterium]|nr:hypothetical protein [Verrucomicrobiota bacterium]